MAVLLSTGVKAHFPKSGGVRWDGTRTAIKNRHALSICFGNMKPGDRRKVRKQLRSMGQNVLASAATVHRPLDLSE